MGATGLESSAKSSGKPHVSETGGSKSGNKSASNADLNPPAMPADPELAAVVAAWPDLPPAIRAGVVAMIRTSAKGGDDAVNKRK